MYVTAATQPAKLQIIYHAYLVSDPQSVMAMHLFLYGYLTSFLPIVCSVQPTSLPCLAIHLYLATMPVPSHSALYLLSYPTYLVIYAWCHIYSNYSLLYCLVCTAYLACLQPVMLTYSMHTYLLYVPIQLVMPKQSSQSLISFQVCMPVKFQQHQIDSYSLIELTA